MFTNTASATRMIAAMLLTLALFAAFGAAAAVGASDQPPPDEYMPDEVVVKLFAAGDLAGIAASYNLEPTALSQFGARPIYRLRILDGANPIDRAAQLGTDPRVEYAEPNYIGETPEGRQRTPWAVGGSIEEFVTQWAPAVIRLPEAHAITRGAGVTVAVLDTGVDATHPALVGRLLPGFDFVDMDDDPSEVGVVGEDLVYGHGTHVAGIIALTAPHAQIMPVRVLDRDGMGNLWVLSEALAYVVDPDRNPATDDGAHIINLSLSTQRRTNLLSEILAEITCSKRVDDDDDDDDDDNRNGLDSRCRRINGRGVLVVAAAGNSGAEVREYPAAEQLPGLLAVAASTRTDRLASFSTFGRWVQASAPGEDILSSIPGNLFGVWSGTSMATPFAAGQAALIWSINPGLQPAEVVQRIVSTAARIGEGVPPRIDVAASITQTRPINGVCQGFVGAIQVDNLLVMQNTSCMLLGTQVKGSIKVERGASLTAENAHINGSIQGDKAATIRLLAHNVIQGSIQIKESAGVTIERAWVGGDIQLESNRQEILVRQSEVKGNLQFFKNRGSGHILENTIGGNLQCKENQPAPTAQNNAVSGKAEDQCAGF